MNVFRSIFAIKMPRKDISLLSERELALTVLSKLLYHLATRFPDMEEIISHHRNLLLDYQNKETAIDASGISDIPHPHIHEIPWGRMLDAIASQTPFLKKITQEYQFSIHEIRYMCAMLCGLSGKEYGLITGLKSHYNLSWVIRHKLGLPSKTTNLRIALQKLSDGNSYESSISIVPN